MRKFKGEIWKMFLEITNFHQWMWSSYRKVHSQVLKANFFLRNNILQSLMSIFIRMFIRKIIWKSTNVWPTLSNISYCVHTSKTCVLMLLYFINHTLSFMLKKNYKKKWYFILYSLWKMQLEIFYPHKYCLLYLCHFVLYYNRALL